MIAGLVILKLNSITQDVCLVKIWGKPSAEMDFNLAGKKYLYLRYTDKNQYPLADFTLDLKDNSVVERLFYPQKNIDGDIFNTFKKKYFKNITFNKVLDSCSHHDQFIYYNKTEGVIIFSHQPLNSKRLVDVVGYSEPTIIEKRLLENKTKKCGVNLK